MLTSIVMYLKRSLSKLVRSFLRSPAMIWIRSLLEKTSFIHQYGASLPPLSLLVLCVYLNCGITSLLLDIIVLFIALWIIAVMLYQGQDLLLYFPNEPETGRVHVPYLYRTANYESVTIKTADETLIHAFLIKHDRYNEQPTVVMYHGNAGNIGYRVENAFHLVQDCGLNVLLMEYRGYGLSGGTTSEQGIYDDAVSAVKYIKNRKDLDPSKIVVMGRSLGGAVAIDVATHPECSDLLAVVIENTFTSLPDIAKRVLNFSLIKAVPEWFYKNKYKSLEKIANVRQPTLFLSGRSDALIPPSHMDALYTASGSKQKEMSSFLKGSHNDTWQQPGYFFAIHNFLQRL